MFRNYFEARDWLESFIPQTYSRKILGLERIEYLLELLGNPQEKLKSIHVGGTSGKGTTAYYIARLLQCSKFQISNSKLQTNSNNKLNKFKKNWNLGFGVWKLKPMRIGLHLSPHLSYIGERMQINGKSISVKRLVRLINEIKPVVEFMRGSQSPLRHPLRSKSFEDRKGYEERVGSPSYFEILVAASFKYFAEEKVDYAVVEVGLGGKYDATNVLEPKVSVITNVGLDHTEILGKTIEKIAEEKAGIIKPKTTIITGANGKALKVIEKVAKSKNAPLIKINTQIGARPLESDTLKPPYIYKETLRNTHSPFALSSGLLAIEAVSSFGIRLNRQLVQKAFNKGLEGRFEVIDKGIILDGAHNEDKIRFLIEYISHWQLAIGHSKKIKTNSERRMAKGVILVIAFKKGKDWKKMVYLLLKNLPVKQVITTKFNNPTDTGFFASVDPEEIARYVSSMKYKVLSIETYENSQEAVFEALNTIQLSNYPTIQLIMVTGSLYLIGEARTMWHLPNFA